MRVSVVIAILESHEIVRRQLLYFQKMNLPDDVEFVWADDGSEIPVTDTVGLKNLTIFQTHDKRAWTQPIARNKAVHKTKGEYLICTDLDHIIPKEVIETARTTEYDVINFKRQAAVLDEFGNFTQDHSILRQYGLTDRWFGRHLDLGRHGNSYIMKRDVFLKYGGSREDRVMTYPNRDEVHLRSRIRRAFARGEITISPDKPMIYCIPNGRFCGDLDADPLKLFHGMKRREFLNKDSLHKA